MRSVESAEGTNHGSEEEEGSAEAFDFGPEGVKAPKGCGTCIDCIARKAEASASAKGRPVSPAQSPAPSRRPANGRVKLFRATQADVWRAMQRGQIHPSEVQLEIDHDRQQVIIRYGVGLC